MSISFSQAIAQSKLFCCIIFSIDDSCLPFILFVFGFFFVALGESDARPLENWIIKPSYWFFSWVYSWCYHVGTLALNHAERFLLAAWQLFPLICFVTFPLFTTPSLPKGGESENHYVESFHFPVRVFLLNATQMVGFLFLFSPDVNKQISKC